MFRSHTFTAYTIFAAAALCAAAAQPVTVREDKLTIPTYPAAPPDRAPLFYEGRAYQGAKGPVYPYPIIDKLYDKREDKTYRAVWLENEYVRLCVVPDLGGRIFEAVDKTNNYDFFYRQHVVKPALIGMTGAWISGGVEWNIPHHHRASSFLPVQYRTEEHPDGAKTVWVGEMELRHRMRWIMGLTLRPGKSYVEATLKLFNNTPVTNSFLYFANVAVHTNDNYQVIFPPSVDLATQHSKVQFSYWPVSKQVYGGVDFRKGVDVSWYKNHPSPTSMFAFESDEDFLAGYDHGKRAGTMHIADRGIMPGKKFFTWGVGGDGRMWDDILTDADGPYLELMVGGYSDNQPDYSWIQPYEVKTLQEFWYPFRDIGGVKSATLDAAVNLDIRNGKALAGAYVTSVQPGARVTVMASGKNLLDRTVDLAPDRPFTAEVALPPGTAERDVKIAVTSGSRELVSFQPLMKEQSPLPATVTPPARPEKIGTNEELLLAGQRLEQFYSPAREPDAYYEEAVKRDPSDVRANTALGLLMYRRGQFEQAEARFRAAVERLTKHYTRPRDGEALYYLGLTQRALGKHDAASDHLYRASWSYAWHSASRYALAELSGQKRDFTKALEHLAEAETTAAINTKVLALRSAMLRALERKQEAAQAAAKARAIDPLDHWARREARLTAGGAREPIVAGANPNDDVQPYLEIAINYGNAGLYADAVSALEDLTAAYPNPSAVHPMVQYSLGYYAAKAGNQQLSAAAYGRAAKLSPDYVFPFRLEEIAILRAAIGHNARDARAAYYLGNLLYDIQPAEAIRHWERSRDLDPSLAMVHRNLALGYARRERDLAKAIPALERALALEPNPRFVGELDELYEAAGRSPAERLAFFNKHQKVALERDDATTRLIALAVRNGRYDEALSLLSGRKFHIWEGAANTVHDSYVDAHLLKGHAFLKAGNAAEALKHYRAALDYPAHLGVGRPYRGDRSPVMQYYIALAEEKLGQQQAAAEALKSATSASRQDPEIRFHQALALKRSGDAAKAEQIFRSLIQSAEDALKKGPEVDEFAKFGERVRPAVQQARAHYLAGLGYIGTGDAARAKAEFEQALKLDSNQLWASYYLSTL